MLVKAAGSVKAAARLRRRVFGVCGCGVELSAVLVVTAAIAVDGSLGSTNVRVIINPGVYRESVSLQPKGARANAAIHLQAKENGTVTIAGWLNGTRALAAASSFLKP